MSTIQILWVDLRSQPNGGGLGQLVSDEHRLTSVRSIDGVRGVVRSAHPDMACVEFDYPDQSRLSAVPAIRRSFPKLPLLMFTEFHSEAVAVQAFRRGVWDYRVKPVSRAILDRSIEDAVVRSAQDNLRGRDSFMPAELVSPGGHLAAPILSTVRTAAAVAHLAGHSSEPVSRKAMAKLCHLSESEFSRVFRREHEITFESYLVEFRITKARELLMDSRLTITQVAHAAGFNDASYFARAFRRLVGVSATDWRRRTRGAGKASRT